MPSVTGMPNASKVFAGVKLVSREMDSHARTQEVCSPKRSSHSSEKEANRLITELIVRDVN